MTPVPDYTYLSTAAQCARKFFHRYEEGLAPMEVSAPLHAGSALHAGLHTLYVTGWDLSAALEALRSAWGDYWPSTSSKWAHLTCGFCEVVLRNYAEDHSADEFELVRVDGLPLAEQAVVVDWDGLTYGGKIDLPVRKDGGIYVLDFKTTNAWLSDWWAQKFDLSHQLRGYIKMASLKTGLRFQGAYVMGVHMGPKAAQEASAWKKVSTPRSKLFGPYLFSPAMLEETREWVESMQRTIAFWRSSAVWPQSEGQQCASCEFKPLCKASPLARTSLAQLSYGRHIVSGVLASGADTEREEAA